MEAVKTDKAHNNLFCVTVFHGIIKQFKSFIN